MSAAFVLERTWGRARAGSLTVRGRRISTPAFLPVGTYGAVKTVDPRALAETGTQMVLANACHLHDRPGEQVVATLGGLHAFMSWPLAILTDSGGFQIFSLRDSVRLDEHGVTLRSPTDGRPLRLEPRTVVDIQRALDSDVAMVLDDCPPLPAPRAQLEASVARTTRWARAAREHHAATSRGGQALFGIVQGGLDDALRERSAQELIALDFEGYALGGLSVGESRGELAAALVRYAPLLPSERVRYLMGVGRPADVVCAVAAGFDLFDSVLPTRNARHGTLFTSRGSLHLRNQRWRSEPGPLDADCDCGTCRRWSVGALRHLFVSGEPLAQSLATVHNLTYLHRLVARLRAAILAGTAAEVFARYGS